MHQWKKATVEGHMENEPVERKSDQRGPRAKRWCFTVNNYTSEDEEEIKAIDPSVAGVIIAGREVGRNGTPHIQGYIEFATRKRMSEIKRIGGMFGRCHLEVARGSPRSNYEYCSKDGDILFVRGNFRESLQDSNSVGYLFEQLVSGKRDRELWASEDTFGVMLRHHRAIQAYRLSQSSQSLRLELRVFVFIGEPGTGKTRAVYESEQPGDLYWHTGQQWFDGYSGEPAVVFDDFSAQCGIPFAFFLRLLDIYPVRVPIKGGFVDFTPVRIYITSNKEWHQWYGDDELGRLPTDSNPLKRRLHEIRYFGS